MTRGRVCCDVLMLFRMEELKGGPQAGKSGSEWLEGELGSKVGGQARLPNRQIPPESADCETAQVYHVNFEKTELEGSKAFVMGQCTDEGSGFCMGWKTARALIYWAPGTMAVCMSDVSWRGPLHQGCYRVPTSRYLPWM